MCNPKFTQHCSFEVFYICQSYLAWRFILNIFSAINTFLRCHSKIFHRKYQIVYVTKFFFHSEFWNQKAWKTVQVEIHYFFFRKYKIGLILQTAIEHFQVSFVSIGYHQLHMLKLKKVDFLKFCLLSLVNI